MASLVSYWFVMLPDIARLAKKNPSTTVLIEARRAEAAEKGQPFRPSWAWAPLARISPHLQRAVIVSEDASFYEHHGFDWEGLQEAITRNWEQGKLHERRLSKKRILELYLNVAEWGHEVFGAEAAARHHFGKSAAEMTEEEAALLAALLPAPRRNDPIQYTPYLARRQEEILYWMHREIGALQPAAP